MPPVMVQDLITSAMRLIHVLGAEEVPTASEANDALFVFQGMIDSWNAEHLAVFSNTRLVFPLQSGQQSYNYGLNPPNPWDFNSPRPAKIDRMGIIWLGNPAQPLELPLEYYTTDQWANIPVKNIQSSLPQYVWDDQGFPFRVLNFWPIPNVTDQVVIYPWVALTEPSTLTTVIAQPPGYQQALRFNLAVMLAAEFPPVPPQVVQMVAGIAAASKAVIKTMNQEPVDIRCDPALTIQGNKWLYNWLSDSPAGR
jgi:hypothetical protein